MTLQGIFDLCVVPFDAAARARRESLYHGLEQLVQSLLVAKIPCDVLVNGSFFTEKPEPDDVDVKVYIDVDAHAALTDEQLVALNSINDYDYIPGVDGSAWVSYPRGHPDFGSALDLRNASEDYGLEHSESWLKGYAALMLWETDVGIRIRS